MRVIASDALTPLGSEYLGVFRVLLDPLTKRADIAPAAANRYTGGFSVQSLAWNLHSTLAITGARCATHASSFMNAATPRMAK